MFPKSTTDSYYDEEKKEGSSDSVETVVGPSVVVEGDFASDGDILVKGTVSGSVRTGKRLTVEKGAKILASVRAGDAIVSGEIKGNIKTEGKLELTQTAKILGDIICSTLVVSVGALIQGKISMKGLESLGGKLERKNVLSKATKKLVGDKDEI